MRRHSNFDFPDRDSEAYLLNIVVKMKQISYLTMFFLPGSLMAVRKAFSSCSGMPSTILLQGIFGMLNPNALTLVYFVVVTVPLTLITLWIGVALQ
jgi:hypothetical protein